MLPGSFCCALQSLSPRSFVRLGVRHQLIRSVDGPTRKSSSWGISLPSTFMPHSMSIAASGGKAVLLITDPVETMLVFQLQRINIGGERLVKGSLAFHGGFNPDVKSVFLASARFEFDLEDTGKIFTTGCSFFK